MPAIHQFVAGFAKGDAISNEALLIRGILRGWGFASEIFCEARRILPELRKQCIAVEAYAGKADASDVILLQLSIGSMINDVFAALPCRKAILYHNMTPAHFFRICEARIAHDLEWGRRQAAGLAGAAAVNMAASAYNARELADWGYKDVRVLPLILDLDRLGAAPDHRTLRRFSDGKINVLSVGRCAPNKKIEDSLIAFGYFQRTVAPGARFIHVGSYAGTESYYALLLAIARDLQLQDVHFTGSVPQSELNAFYACSRLFICMSEHEGYCIPLVESMARDVPVLAYAAAAVPETMNGAGVLFARKQYDAIAEMMGRLTHDAPFREEVLVQQRRRIERYRRRDLQAELRAHLAPLL